MILSFFCKNYFHFLLVLLFVLLSLLSSLQLLHATRVHHSRGKNIYREEGKCSIQLPSIIASNMIIQREPSPNKFWGWTSQLNCTVEMKILYEEDDSELLPSMSTISSDDDGSFVFTLSPVSVSDYTFKIIFTGIDNEGNESAEVITNVIIGDVFICSGEGNMQFSVSQLQNASTIEKEADQDTSGQKMRMFVVDYASSEDPQKDVKSVYGWQPISSKALTPLQDKDKRNDEIEWQPYFSSTCYLAMKKVYDQFSGIIPTGAIQITSPDSYIQSWLPEEIVVEKVCPESKPLPEKEEEEWKGEGKSSQLYNGMVYPLLQLSRAGFIFWHGESHTYDPTGYSCLLQNLVTSWRSAFATNSGGCSGDADFSGAQGCPFIFFDLPSVSPNVSNGTYSDLRQSQYDLLSLNMTFIIPNADLSDLNSPFTSKYPQNTRSILADRFLETVLDVQYAGDIKPQVPLLVDATAYGLDNITLTYIPNQPYGLHFQGTKECTTCCEYPTHAFEISADNGNTWHYPVSIELNPYTNMLTLYPPENMFNDLKNSNGDNAFTDVRYAHFDFIECMLYNSNNYPAFGFWVRF